MSTWNERARVCELLVFGVDFRTTSVMQSHELTNSHGMSLFGVNELVFGTLGAQFMDSTTWFLFVFRVVEELTKSQCYISTYLDDHCVLILLGFVT